MNENRNQKFRTESEVIADLECLCQESGFVYTFCNIILSFLWMSPDELADIDWSQRPNIQELSFLLGLMVKRPLRLTDLPSSRTAEVQAGTANRLLKELHNSHSFSLSRVALETHQNLEDWVAEHARAYDDWMDSGRGLVEPIFYGGGGADDFQYLEMAERRYKNDRDWLENHLGISFSAVAEVARKLDRLFTTRINNLRFGSTFEEMCLECFAAFSFSPHDIPDESTASIDSFLRVFSLSPGEVNQNLDTIGAYNAAQSHPVIRLGPGRYFVPIFFNLARSIYESPYYWMLEDSSYADEGFQNRGYATEEIAYELLTDVFGENNVYGGVTVREGKDDITDVDILAIQGNKALIVQAKSKKLTEKSRRGKEEQLKSDFQAAVQDAYNQALLSRKAILEPGSTLLVNGKTIDQITAPVDEAYIVCLTGDHYPAVTTQLDSFLQKKEGDPHPIAMSIFDLDVVAFYLQDPFDLLYYLKQRSSNAKLFLSDTEMGFLGFHLKHKLILPEEADLVYIDPGYAQLVDAHFPVAKGRWPATEATIRLFQEWKSEWLEEFADDIKMTDDPSRTDAVFLMYDLEGTRTDTLFKAIDKVKAKTRRDGGIHIASILSVDNTRGISYISYPKDFNYTELNQEQFQGLAIAERHKSKADEWLAFASRIDSPAPFDMLCFHKEAWRPDSDLDRLAKELLKSGHSFNLDGRKIGRNSPCPCGSGLKFKKCHGKR